MTDERTERVKRRRSKRVAEPRNKIVGVRFTQAEHQNLSDRAEASGHDLGAYLRTAVLGAKISSAIRRPPIEKVELGKALGLIGLYGSNVNQLARVANLKGELPMEGELQIMAAEIREIRSSLMKALGYDH